MQIFTAKMAKLISKKSGEEALPTSCLPTKLAFSNFPMFTLFLRFFPTAFLLKGYIKGLKFNVFFIIYFKIFGDGIFNNDGEKWRIQRQTATPLFHYANLQTFVPVSTVYF